MLLSRIRHLFKVAIPRDRSILGVSFPSPERTRSLYLNAVGDDIGIVKDGKGAVVTRSGVIRVHRAFLDIDYGPYSEFRTALVRSRKRTYYPRVVSLWTHPWSTYYHWLIDVAPKIAAAKQHFGSDMDQLIFTYPRVLTSYEADTLEMLSVPLSKIVNPHRMGEISSAEIFVLPLPGFHKISPRIFKLRQIFATPLLSQRRRLYIARSGRRRISNEADLFQMLMRHGFEFISDSPRTVSQQISLFASASHIISPHGAALSNILWVGEGARVLELAASKYAPNFFVTLASMLHINLKKLTFGTTQSHWSNLAQDFAVQVERVQRFIEDEWGL
jgi:capsular polysaccharide biosynthesis protein